MKNEMNLNTVSFTMLPGGGFHGGENRETLPGGGFHGGENRETLPGGGFHSMVCPDFDPGSSVYSMNGLESMTEGVSPGYCAMPDTGPEMPEELIPKIYGCGVKLM